MIKLNLGCGPTKKEGFIGVDKIKLPTVDIVHNLNAYPYPFKDNSINEIYCSHIIEHLSDFNKTMEELWRICKPNATIFIQGPYYKSYLAFGDSTHKQFLTERSFDYFRDDHQYSFYSYARFEMLEVKLIACGIKAFIPFKRFLNYFLWNIFDDISFKLRVDKNQNRIPSGDLGIPGERNDIRFEKNIRVKHEHLQRYKYALKICKGKILDLGCGTGYGSKLLYDAGNKVFAIDVSPDTINYAVKNYPGPKYICCSAEKLPFENNYFDGVIAFEVIEHVSNPESVLKEIYRVLKRDGSLLVSTPNPRHLYNTIRHFLLGRPYPEKQSKHNIYHIKEFYYDEFFNFINRGGFKVVSKYGQSLFSFPKKIEVIINKSPFYLVTIFLGYIMPKYALTIVIHARKK